MAYHFIAGKTLEYFCCPTVNIFGPGYFNGKFEEKIT